MQSSYRFMLKSKSFTLINLSGLVIGLTVSFYLLAYTINETSYNSYVPDSENVVRWLYTDINSAVSALTPMPLIDSLRRHPENYTQNTRLAPLSGIIGQVEVQQAGKFVEEHQFWIADPEFFTMFGIPVLATFHHETFSGPSWIALSETNARKYFGTQDPIGSTIHIRAQGIDYPMKISAIYKDFPWNSTFKPGFIVSPDYLLKVMQSIDSNLVTELTRMSYPIVETYSRINPGIAAEKSDFNATGLISYSSLSEGLPGIRGQKIEDIYLTSGSITGNFHSQGDPDSIFIYTTLAFVVLMLAGINYAILSTARSALRYKEIGIRKILGATKPELRMQILAESVLLTFLSFPLALLIMGLLEPLMEFYKIFEIRLYRQNIWNYLMLFGTISLLIGVLSGSYTAMFLSALKPMEAIKAKLYPNKKFNLIRVFIILQLAVTLGLLIGVITIARQLWLCHTRSPGFDRENLTLVRTMPGAVQDYINLTREIKSLPGVLNVSGTSFAPFSEGGGFVPVNLFREGVPVSCVVMNIDSGFFKTLGVRLISGMDFHHTIERPLQDMIIINQTLANLKPDELKAGNQLSDKIIIGISEDFHIHSLHSRIFPMVCLYNPEAINTIIVRSSNSETQNIIPGIRKVLSEKFSHLPASVYNYDQALNNAYRNERVFGIMVSIMAALSILVTAMGLFGLAILLSERRTKEIAIRKVFGASDLQIMYYMQREFLVYTLIASLIAIPATILLMNMWLQTFYFHVSFGWYSYILSVIGVAGFVSLILMRRIQSILEQNPINSLKYD